MATRHELIHIDFVANAGKANPVLQSLKDSCEKARVAKEDLDNQLASAKAANAPTKIINEINEKLREQTKIYTALQRGVREYAKGIDTLSKGIKEYNEGTLDQMSPKFNKALENSAKLAQSNFKSNTKEWSDLQTVIEAAHRNVVRAREDIDGLMQSMQTGASVSANQLNTAKEVLKDLAELAVVGSEDWRGLQKQMNEVAQAAVTVAETERRLKGEIVDEQDAMRLSQSLTKESIAQRHAMGEAFVQAAQKERSGIEQNIKAVSDKMALERQEREELKDTIKIQESYDETIEKRKKKIADAEGRKQEAEKKKAQAEATIKEYDEQGKKVKELKIQKDALESQYNKETQAAEKAAKSTKTQSEAYDEQTAKVNKLDGEIKTLDGDLDKVNADIEKMTAAQKKSAESSEKQAAAKEKEVKATKEKAEAKKEEVKTEEVAVKTVEVEKETVESLIAANDKLKIKIQELNEERKKLAEVQKQGAAATKEEINAFKDLTKEQAQAMLDSKKATITKGGDGKISYTNADDAQRFLIESIKSVNPGGVNGGAMSLDSAGVTKVRAMFKERFGLESDDDTLAAIRGLLSGGNGSLIKGGMMNNAFSRIDIDTSKVAAYSKEIKDLTAVINGEVEAVKEDSKAVEENAEKKRTLEQVEKEIEAAEKESMQLSIRTMRLRNGQSAAIDTEVEKTDNLTESKKRNVEAMKAEIAAIKEMTAEQAKAAKDAMLEKSTVGYKAGKVDMSNPEEVQSFLISRMSKKSAIGRNGNLSISGGQIDSLIKDFQERYGLTGNKKNVREILKSIAGGAGGGLLEAGGAGFQRVKLDNETVDMFSIKIDKEALEERKEKLKALVAVTNAASEAAAGVTETTKKGTEAAKDATKATEGETDAIKRQIAEVERRKAAYDKFNDDYEAKKAELQKKRSALSRLPKSGADALLERDKLQQEIDDYKEGTVDPARKEATRLKKLWQQSVEQYTKMAGIESEATEKTKKRTKATKEQTKATEEAAKAEMTMDELLAKKAELEEKLTNKKKKLQEEQTKLNELQQQSIEGDKAETSSTKELFEAKKKEYDTEKAKFDEMTENKVKKKAGDTIRGAEKSIKNAEETIITTKNEALPQRMTEAEIGKMKKRVAELNDEIEKDTKNFDELSQKIYAVNKRETDAAIEMAQSENVSMEKVKQAIDLLKEKIRTEATDEQTMQARGEAINRLTERYTQMNAEVVKLSKPIADRLSTEDFGKMSETEIRQGIDAANQLIKTYESGSDEAKKLAENIVRAEKHIRENGVEAARQAQQQKDAIEMMENQLSKGSALTESALKAQVRYWQQLADDPKAAAEAVKQYTANMEKAQELLKQRNEADIRDKAGRLQNMDNYSVAELKEGIEAAKVMQQTFHLTDDEVKKLSEDIVAAETRINKVSVETERAAQKQRESIELMQNQLNSGAALTESALKAQVQYWQRLADDPKTAAESVKIYTDNLEKAQELLKQRNEADIRDKAGRLQNMDNYSVAELKEGIEAAKQMQQTFHLTDEQVKQLSEDIVKAETRISKVSVETERAAQKQREGIAEMSLQLRQGLSLSESALKTQINYWKRLIDDPKVAAENIDLYKRNLEQAEGLLKGVASIEIDKKGEEALRFFRGNTENASASLIDENAKALKAYRDSLPAKDKADVIAEIDGYLQKTGQSAKKAAEDVMSLEDALELAGKAGQNYFLSNDKKGFVASPEQIQQATKAIELEREAVIKLIQQKKASNQTTEAEERKLADLTKKLKDLKFEQDNLNMSQEKMQMLMKQPTQAVNLDELRAAIKRADGELKRMEGSMGKNSKEYKNFAEQVKNAKNQLKEMEGQAKATSSAWDKAWSRLKTYVGMYMGFNILWQKMTGTMDDMMTLSDKMGEVRKTTGFTADEVGRLSDNLAKLDTRTNLTGLMEFSSLAGSIGLKTQEAVQGFTEAANMIAVSLPEMGNEASRTLMKIADATGDLEKNGGNVRETLERVGSTIIALRANSAAAAGPITDFVSRVGAVGAQAGISIDQIAALGATVDALGGRVEMSATALSRMIPAIRNNTFEVAKAVGLLESELKGKSGMEQMVAIFRALHDSVKGFDTSTEEGMNAMADAVENAMGRSVSMQETMKALNQQGARAGIVFGLLSQNVDKLEEQLGTAANAYRENTALLDEYNKMNDTTAAKWDRLKNQLEEMFVSDSMQKFLGGIITALRGLVDLISGNVSPALKTLNIAVWVTTAYFAAWRLEIGKLVTGAFSLLIKGLVGVKNAIVGLATAQGRAGIMANIQKAIGVTKMYIAANWTLAFSHDAAAKSAAKATLANNALAKSLKANVVMAVVAAIAMLIYKLHEWNEKAKEAGREAAKFQSELDKEQKKVNKLTESIGDARVKTEDANKAVAEAKKKLEDVKKATDGTAESAAKLKKAEEDLTVAEENKRKQMAEHKRLITEFNTQYSKYLGFMLSEVSSNLELARARDLVNDKLRETITLKRQEAALGRVEEEHGTNRDKKYGNLYDYAGVLFEGSKGGDPTKRPRLMADITKAANSAKDRADFERQMKQIAKKNNITASGELLNKALEYYNEVANVREATNRVMEQIGGEQTANREALRGDMVRQANAGFKNYNTLLKKYKSAKGDDRAQAAANLLKQMDTMAGIRDKAGSYYDMSKSAEAALYQKQFGQLNAWQGYNRDELLKIAGNLYTPAGGGTNGGGGGGGGTNPYGDYDKVKSAYSEWNGNDLVARRKEMLERVKALANGADVQAVLSEDAKFISEAVRKNIKTTEQAIEWYNTERLKIQEALKAKHLTPTGDWLDPKSKSARNAARMVKDDMKYYLDELDAYYTERKAKIQEAQNDQEISEAEARNRTLANEAEWQQRRAELQLLYTKKSEKVTEEEQQAIFDIITERTGETAKFIVANIAQTNKFIEAVGQKSVAAMKRIYGDNELDAEKSFLKQRNAIGQHMKAIQDIIDKERPFNGITKNLQDNLTTMGILAGHMQKELDELNRKGEDTTDFNNRQTAEKFRELTFLLGESEHAYATTIEEVMKRASDEGLTAWVEYMRQNPKAQEGMMAQLRSTYDAVQDAIKKEASQMKKQAEIMWNNILLPGGDGKTTIKDALEKTISQLGIEQGRVSRANSLIGAGQASERVADKLAIKQMQLQLTMQQHYYNLMQKQGQQRVKMLDDQAKKLKQEYETLKAMGEESKAQQKMDEYKAKMLDKQHAEMSLNLATTKEQTELDKQREEIIARTEESQARLYKELREWGDLLASSLQSVMEASNAGNAEYYNELAKLNLTGKGGPGAGTYIVIENEGTEDATAHYEYLDERQALERQREIEQENARAEALEKAWDDINAKINDVITDQINAMLQNEAIDTNTTALNVLTAAVNNLAGVMGGQPVDGSIDTFKRNAEGFAVDDSGQVISPIQPADVEQSEGMPKPLWPMSEEHKEQVMEWQTELWDNHVAVGMEKLQEMNEGLAGMPSIVTNPYSNNADEVEQIKENAAQKTQAEIDNANRKTQVVVDNANKEAAAVQNANKKSKTSTQSSFAAMAAACNMYGLAYQTVTNDNLSASQKFQMFALQAAGQTAIGMLTTDLFLQQGKAKVELPGILGKAASQLGPIAGPIAFAAMTALLGGLMGLAVSQVAKSKSQISQVTGASVGAGRLSTGMLTYAEGNVNEFTDPNSLTPGRSYNVDAADGKTYRAKYTGKNPSTHLTNGPEFHLAGEAGREMIIDAGTTRQITMNDNDIWRAIQTLSAGGSMRRMTSRRRGVRAFADGNVDDFESMDNGELTMDNSLGFDPVALQSSLDRNTAVQEALLERLSQPIQAKFDVYGKGGLVDSYDTGKKTVQRHGERY